MALNFVAQLAIQVALTIASSLLLRRERAAVRADPLKIDPPNPDEPVPLVFGTMKVPLKFVAVWYTRAVPEYKKSRLFGSAALYLGKTQIATRYWITAPAILCHGPVDRLVDLIVDGKSLVRAGQVFGAGVPGGPGMVGSLLDHPGLLGGDIGGNGSVYGVIRHYLGQGLNGPDEEAERYGPQDNVFRPNAPDWRHYSYLVFDDVWLGNAPVLPPLHAVVQRAPRNPWDAPVIVTQSGSDADGDANPGPILWELWTDPDTGLALPIDAIDVDNLEVLTGYCAGGPDSDRAFGLSFGVDRFTPAEQIEADVLRALDGTRYTDPLTAKLGVWLHREPSDTTYGYTLANLVTIKPGVATSCRLTEPAPQAQINEVRILFADRARGYQRNIATARNLALINAMGRTVPETVDLRGVTTEGMALRLAARELRQLTTPVRTATLVCDRRPAGLHEGRQFKLVWPEHDIAPDAPLVMRVVTIDHGTIEDPRITIEAVEDVYSMPGYAADRVVTGVWQDPSPPQGLEVPRVVEEVSRTAMAGTLTLAITDPQGLVTAVEFSTQTGREDPTPWMEDSTAPYVATVPLHARHESFIGYHVTYTLPGGTSDTIEGVVDFGRGTEVPPPEMLEAGWTVQPQCDPEVGPLTQGTGWVKIRATFDEATHFRWEAASGAPFDPSGSWIGGTLVPIPPKTRFIIVEVGSIGAGEPSVFVTAVQEFTEAGELVQSPVGPFVEFSCAGITVEAIPVPDPPLPAGIEGDLLRYKDSAWQRLAIGTPGQVLFVSDDLYPEWGGAADAGITDDVLADFGSGYENVLADFGSGDDVVNASFS